MPRSARVPPWWRPWLVPWFALKVWRERPRPVNCMPWPLAVLCWADHRAHERLGEGVMRPVCAAHDLAWACWLRVKRPARV